MNDQILPRANSSERYLIGCIVRYPDRAGELLPLARPADFVDVLHQQLWSAFLEQCTRGAVDPWLIGRQSGETGYLQILMDEVVTSQHAADEAGKIIEARRKRQLHSIAETAVNGALNGQTAGDVYRLLTADLNDWQREMAGSKTLLSDAVPVGEFVNQDHRVEYLIPHVLTAKQAGVMSARAKSLKTTIVLDAKISMATATRFLGYWEIPYPIKCGILTAESGAATISETIERIAASKGIDARDIDNCIVSTKCPRLRSQDWLDEIRRFIDDNELRCLTIDPTYLAMAGVDQNTLASMGTELAPVAEIIEATGCTILMVHHNRKITADRYGCPTLEEITGSGFAEWARCWLLMNRRREWDEETGRHWLWFVAGGSAGFGARKWLEVREGKPTDPGGRVWEVSVLSATDGQSQEKQEQERQQEEREADQREADKRKLVDVLRKCAGREATKSDIRDRAGLNGGRLSVALADLLTSGDFESTMVARNNGQKYAGYKLNSA